MLKYCISDKDSEILRLASPMDVIGKVGISDAILKKPARLTEDEFEVMKTHAQLGYEMLKGSKRTILQASAIVAGEHHEKWDGSGYPHQKVGKDTHIYGRITAVADVFDALASDRVYKKAWPMEKIVQLFKDESGKHFEPKLVDILLENLEEFKIIMEKFKDVYDDDLVVAPY